MILFVLFRFGGETIAEAHLDKAINDGQYHHVKVVKGKDTMTVYVDGKEVLHHQFDAVDNYFNQAHVGVGLWDGSVEFQNFFVTEKMTNTSSDTTDEPIKPDPQPEPSPEPKPEHKTDEPEHQLRLLQSLNQLGKIMVTTVQTQCQIHLRIILVSKKKVTLQWKHLRLSFH